MKKMITVLLALALVLSLAACNGNAAGETTAPAEETTLPATEPQPVDLQALYDTVAAQMPEMVVLDATMMFNYCGIPGEDCAQAVVATCADGLRTDEIWIIEAVDADALARLQALAQTRLTVKDEESVTYSPEQNAVVKKAQTITNGLYFALIVSPDVDSLAGIVGDGLGK